MIVHPHERVHAHIPKSHLVVRFRQVATRAPIFAIGIVL